MILIVLSTAYSCDVCERDPCQCESPVSADFIMEESSDWFPNFTMETDTMILGNNMVFTALDETASTYEWKVGFDPRTFSESQFHLSFEDTTTIEVRLIVTKTKHSECFTEAELRDTVVKQMHVHDWKTAPTYGKYVGNLEIEGREPKEIEIEIFASQDHPFTLSNLIDDEFDRFDNCQEIWSGATFYRAVSFESDPGCHNEMVAILSPNHKTLSIDFGTWNYDTQDYIPSRFIGNKKY